MSRQRLWQPPPNSPVLVVGSAPEDHDALVSILTSKDWRVQEAASCAEALSLLRHTRFPVLICHAQVAGGHWRDLLGVCQLLPTSPQFIVFSRLADCDLWAEVLNLGAWDVLGAPPVADEVLGVVGLATQRWWRQRADVQRASAAPSNILEEELKQLAEWGLSDGEIAEVLGIPSVEAARRLGDLHRKELAGLTV